jgi:chromosome segregation ATPase
MEPTRLIPPIQNLIVADFLLGAASSALTRKHKMSMGEIYVILQDHFGSMTISRIQQSPAPDTQRTDLDDPTCLDLTRALHDLRDKIRRKEKQISNCNESIQEAERRLGDFTITISQKDQDIHESNEKIRQAEDAIVKMMERQLELNIQRERDVTELTIAIAGLEQEISKQKADITVLESQLQRRFTAPDHRLLTGINIPPNWKLDCHAFIRIAEGSSFLFSMALFDGFLSICTV